MAAHESKAVDVNLTPSNIPSGQYEGTLQFNYTGGSLLIPITIRLKDRWLWPLFVLALGVGIGRLISWYADRGQRRDRLVVRWNELKLEMIEDRELEDSFGNAVDGELSQMEGELRQSDLEAAEESLKRAESIWWKWRKDRTNWILQFRYLNQLRAELKAQDPQGQSPAVTDLLGKLKEIEAEAPELPNAGALRKRLADLKGQIPQRLLPALTTTAPNLRRGISGLTARLARLRLFCFVVLRYLLAVLLLAGAGFNELYSANPVFGADLVRDYLALFVWGLGAEAIRAITAVRHQG
jgi:hypothetical protein